jgi:DNA-binding transcriptional MerR regulator
LLHPVQVDPVSQYRRYDPAQLEQARLVAWLRRLGMPLASIRAVGALPRAEAVAETARYWRPRQHRLHRGRRRPGGRPRDGLERSTRARRQELPGRRP